MKIKEIMTADALKCCNPDTKLNHAAVMMKHGNCGALPVVDEENKVVGMVTDRDICLSLAQKIFALQQHAAVRDIMSSHVISIKEEDHLKDALYLMRVNKIGRLPVTDQDGKLKGIVSLHHLMTHFINNDVDLGEMRSPEENMLKTMYEVTSRYAPQPERKTGADSGIDLQSLEQQLKEGI